MSTEVKIINRKPWGLTRKEILNASQSFQKILDRDRSVIISETGAQTIISISNNQGYKEEQPEYLKPQYVVLNEASTFSRYIDKHLQLVVTRCKD